MVCNLVGFAIEVTVVFRNVFVLSPVKYFLKYLLRLTATILISVFVFFSCSFIKGTSVLAALASMLLSINLVVLIYYLLYHRNKDFLIVKNGLNSILISFKNRIRRTGGR